MAHILLIRFSALGDVAMTVPIVYSLAKQYPQHRFTMLSRAPFAPLFEEMPHNVTFLAAKLQGEHRGVMGIERLYALLRAMHIDAVADLHNVLRTKHIDLRFRLSGIPVAVIDKGRNGKRQLVRATRKVMEQQKTSFERYSDVLKRLGYPVKVEFTSIYEDHQPDFSQVDSLVGTKNIDEKWIGIAPFAKHMGKIYPIDLQEQVVAHFANQPHIRVFLFGGGEKEKAVFDAWTAKYPSVTALNGQLNMAQELQLMSKLNVMLSMDSANMHLASLVNTPVVSIWGATHPYAGFMGWNQSEDRAIQIDLSCRPCSVFGQKPCKTNDYRCMNYIKPIAIIEHINQVINQNNS